MKYFSQFLLIVLFTLLTSTTWASQAHVEGTLTSQVGQPLANTPIKLQNGQGEFFRSTVSDAQGHYQFSGVPVGSYVLLALQEDKVLVSTQLSVLDSTDQHKDLKMASTTTMNIVIAQDRQKSRNSLSPTTGSNAYTMDHQAITALPQGDDTPLDKILLQAPGVAEDSAASGQLHVRGEHANLQYRLNGILLPDGISGFGDTIDTHIIDNATLLDGTLPAQYGFHTAGVVSIDTKNGFQDGGVASVMGGSNSTLQSSASYGGTFDNADYFLALSHLSSDLGIENPTSSTKALHDHTEQNKQFGYGSYMISPMQRVEVVAGNSIGYFQIPNNPNQATGGYQIKNVSTPNSANLNERQFESNQYATLAWQGQSEGLDIQIAPYIRNSEIHYRPDINGDLLFNGVASDVKYTDLATGLQNDNSWKINADHTLRAGFSLQNDHVQNDSNSLAFLTNGAGTPLIDGSGNNIMSSPLINNQAKDGQLYGLYLQEEWKITQTLEINYGARFDDMEQYVSADQFSPRLSLVYKPIPSTTLHAGYARYFTPPPMELVSTENLNQFVNTTNAAQVSADSTVKPERQNSFDVGATQKLDDHWQVGLDSYYKLVHNMLDEGQFGQALILTPFNYQHGYIYGSELTATYSGEKLKAYGNLAISRAMGENIVSSQFNFSSDELAYINNHYVHLDHDQTYTASAGATYEITPQTTFGIDSIFGSGLRKGFANTESLPAYVTFNCSLEQKFNIIDNHETALRLSIVNLLDSSYELRDGTGIGVGAPQWGARRGGFISLAQKF